MWCIVGIFKLRLIFELKTKCVMHRRKIMKSENMKAVRDFVLTVILTLLLLFAAGLVPILSLVFLICCGVPLAVFASKYDLKLVISAFLIIGIAYWPLAGHWTNAATTMMVCVLPGLVAGYLLGRKHPFYSILVATCALVCVGWIFEFIALDKLHGVSIDNLIDEIMGQVEGGVMSVVNQMSALAMDSEQIDIKQIALDAIANAGVVMKVYFPSFIVTLSMLMGYLVLRISGFAIRKFKFSDIDVVPFSMMRAPRSMCWVAVIVYLIYIFSEPLGSLWVILANATFILYAIMAVCGLSFVDFWLAKKIRVTVLRVLIYIGTFLTVGLLLSLLIDGLIIAAILDSGRDFRKLGKPEQ